MIDVSTSADHIASVAGGCVSEQTKSLLRTIESAGILFAIILGWSCEARRIVNQSVRDAHITIAVQVPDTFAATALSLGWTKGVPGVRVVAMRIQTGIGASADTALTDSSGKVHFADLEHARYSITAERDFTAMEQVAANGVLDNVDGLVGIQQIDLGASDSANVSLKLRLVGGASLLISEVHPTHPVTPDGSIYYYDNYWEIYNNTDTIIPLAGKLFIDGFHATIEAPGSTYNCQSFAAFQNDPAGLWAIYTIRFPDDAPPLRAGKTVVIATDAIDHRQFGASAAFFDLSSAQFEFRGSADADNPTSRDMLNVGANVYSGAGHGLTAWTSSLVWALAMPLKLDTLVTRTDPIWGTLVRIPNAALLDVVQWRTATPHVPGIKDCPSPVHSNLDAEVAVMLRLDDTLTMHRKVKRVLSSGRVILQRSRNSAADFAPGRGTPGQVP